VWLSHSPVSTNAMKGQCSLPSKSDLRFHKDNVCIGETRCGASLLF
jgi:hypothetical protein